MEIKNILAEDIRADMLLHFCHCQAITRRWRCREGEWELIEAFDLREWSRDKKIWVAQYLKRQCERGGAVVGAFNDNVLIGFGSVDGVLSGNTARYANLTMLFVDDAWQRKGVGKALFRAASECAKRMGADKLFISAIPSLETVSFYLNMDCMDAKEIIAGFVDTEDDRYLEYPLH